MAQVSTCAMTAGETNGAMMVASLAKSRSPMRRVYGFQPSASYVRSAFISALITKTVLQRFTLALDSDPNHMASSMKRRMIGRGRAAWGRMAPG